ncbi:MAG: DUF4012 domain-containing protein, partial [Candidatus Promineifilaceae bacterium]
MRRLPLLLLLMGLVILLVWAGLIAYHAYSLYQTATQLQDEAQILSEEGLSEFDFDRIEPLVLNARRHFSSLHSAAGPLYGILPYLSWVPKYGPLIAVAPDLMEIGDAGTYAAVELVQGLKPAAYLLQNESGSSPGFFSQALEIVGDADENIQNALAALEYMNQSRNGIEDIGELPWRVRTLLERYDQEVPLLEDALRLSTILPDLLGMDGRKNYLIMAQNEDEIRPTGGFISGAGLLVVEDGQILSISFGDANEVDDYLHKPYDFPPMPFNEIMGMDIFLFRDANYWPNFPESAESAMELYTRG